MKSSTGGHSGSMARLKRRRCASLGLGFGLTTGLVLVALLGIANASSYSIEPRWRAPPLELQQGYAGVDSNSARPTVSSGGYEPQNEDAELEQFLGKLVLARKLLDERLAREAVEQRLRSEQQMAASSGLQLVDLMGAENEPRYKFGEESEHEPQVSASSGSELLAKADRVAQQLRLASLAEQQQQPLQAELELDHTTNPLYYSVSHDEPASTDGEFTGHFGEPIVSRATKRQASNSLGTTLLEDEAELEAKHEPASGPATGRLAANSSGSSAAAAAAGETDHSQTYGTVIEAGQPAEQSKLSAFFQRLYRQLADYAPGWAHAQPPRTTAASEQGAATLEPDSGKLSEMRNSSSEAKRSESSSAPSSAQAASKRLEPDGPLELGQMGWQQQQQQPAASLTRQPSLFVPVDESLLGKYIYAPTQHYYLGASSDSESLPSSQAPQQLFRPAYAAAASAAAYRKPELVLDGSSQLEHAQRANDLYFLIMVGAFCVMAMAVVLAAGLFAYRVQQARKSSQAEQEYPTYGVVGPNNSKCGAAAFMGGYFVGGQHGGPNSASGFVEAAAAAATGAGPANKFGSAKQLAGAQQHQRSSRSPGSGHASDSGLASLDKLSSASKSSLPAASSDQQQVVAAAAAAAAASVQQRQQASLMSCSLASGQDAARMYHYQHQKQQMIVSDRSSAGRHTSASDLDSEDDNDDGSYTVYECPGLASAHEMEIKNPLFNDERTP